MANDQQSHDVLLESGSAALRRFSLSTTLTGQAPLTASAVIDINPRPAPSGFLAFGKAMTERTSDGLDMRRRKLLYRAWHRGVREMDLIVGRFTDAAIDTFSDAELDDFERLIEVRNDELYAWVSGQSGIPADYDTTVMRKLKDFHMRLGAKG
jgi:antitoxin CptB